MFLRHAETPVNAGARLQGRIDPPLDERGRAQARRLGEALRDRWQIDRVVTSPRIRAVETATEAGLSHLPTEIDDRWQELDFGDLDDHPIGSVLDDLIAAWRRDPAYEPPNGESLAALHERVGEAVHELLAVHTDRTVAVVTHSTPVKSAIAWLLRADVTAILSLRVQLAAVTAFVPSRGELVMTDYNWYPPAAEPMV